MKRFILLFAFLIAGAAYSNEIPSKVSSVTVYSDRALVTRISDLALNVGTKSCTFTKLPASLIESSVRIKGAGTALVRIGDVDVRNVHLSTVQDPRVVELKNKIQKLVDEDQGLEDQLAVLKSREEFLKSIKLVAPTEISQQLYRGKINISTLRLTLEFIGKETEKIKTVTRSIKKRREEIERQMDAIEKELLELTPKKALEKKQVTVELEVIKAGNYHLELSYILRDASWLPVYEIRAYPEEETLELAYFGEVKQKSGENWQGVNLVLSTARPALGAVAPKLSPWYLNTIPSRKMARPVEKQSRNMMAQIDLETMEIPPPSQVLTTGLSVNFAITGLKNILSGEGSKKILITRERLPAKFSYVAVPKLSPHVYLNAQVENSTEYLFLSGKTNIFIGTDFVGKSHIGNIPPRDSLKVSLGVDEGIKVERKLVQKFKEKTGLFSKKEKVSYIYRIELQNFKSRPIEINVYDQIPVSQNKEIEIKDVAISPQFSSKQENGILRWQFVMQPKEKKKITLGFTVQYPRGRVPTGIF